MSALAPLTDATHQRESLQAKRRCGIAGAGNDATPPRNYPKYLAASQQLESCAGDVCSIQGTGAGEQKRRSRVGNSVGDHLCTYHVRAQCTGADWQTRMVKVALQRGGERQYGSFARCVHSEPRDRCQSGERRDVEDRTSTCAHSGDCGV
jgi:hypothetical protein